MKTAFAKCLMAGALACTLLSAAAFSQTQPGPTALGDRARLQTSFEQTSEEDLKSVYLRCDRDSRQQLMGFDEALRCVVAGDVLRARSFGGDFNALMAWWRLHRD
jgi:hypothetical protein